MKHILYLLLFFSLYNLAVYAQEKKVTNNFILKGTIKGKHPEVIWLRYPNMKGEIIQQKAFIKNDTFIFKGYISSSLNAEFSTEFYPQINEIKNFSSTLFLSPGDMTVYINGNDFSKTKIVGSVMQGDWDKLRQIKQHTFKIKDSLYTAMFKVESAGNTPKNHIRHLNIASKIEQCVKQEKQIDYKFILTHSTSYLSPYLTQYYFSGMRELPLDSAERFYNTFAPLVKNSIAGQSLQREIAVRKVSAVGGIAPLFVTTDINGQKVDLKSFRNRKYVLLDFWASYCKENPDLIRIYNKYHIQGLEIISSSSFDNEGVWKASIVKYKKTKWSNLMDKKNSFMHKYDLNGMPPSYLFLIDKKGKIIGRYMHGTFYNYINGDNEGTMDDLDKKLNETFGN